MAKPQKDEKAGVYYFRKGVPLALREAVGLTELRKSLGTKDPAEAKRRHAEVALEVDAEWDRLRAALRLGEGSRDPERRPQLISLTQKDAHALAGEFYREFVAENEANPGSADRWTERLLAMATALPLSRREPGAPSHIWNYSMQPNMVAARMFSREVRSFLERRNLALNTLGFRLLSSAVALAMRDAALRLRRNADGDYSPDAAGADHPPVAKQPEAFEPRVAPPGPRLAILNHLQTPDCMCASVEPFARRARLRRASTFQRMLGLAFDAE